MKGGSVSSSHVESLVSSDVYESMNKHFDNLVGGAKSTKKPTKPKLSKPKPPHKHKGGVCMLCGGSTSLMKHINEFDNSGLKTLYNKKGGSNPLYNIKYDISTAFTQPLHGVASKGFDINYDNPTSMSSMNKVVQYGNVSGSDNVKFVYGGGKSSSKGKGKAKPDNKKKPKNKK